MEKHPYRWYVIGTIGFFSLITFIFFALASGTPQKVTITNTASNSTITSPNISFIDPQMGASAPKVTIVEYADYVCTACASLSTSLNQIASKYPNDVRLVWKDFPNESKSPEATPSAIAARCADEQGAFWPYHDQLFLHQGSLSSDAYQTLATSLGLNTNTFKTCTDATEPLPRVRKDYQEGLDLKITATPTLYVNNVRYTGAVGLSDLDALVKNARANH